MSKETPKQGLGLEFTDVSEATMNRLPEPTGDVGFDTPEELIGRLEELLQAAVEVEDVVNDCMDDPQDAPIAALVAQAGELLEASIVLVQRLANHAHHPLDKGVDFSDARFAVSMAIDELERQRRVVAALNVEQAESPRILASVAQAKGVCTKALINVERALCDGTNREPRLGDFLSLEDSLETRRVYGKMRRALLKFERVKEAPSHDEVVARLRRAGTSFVQLRGHDCYPTLRVEDRFQFDRLWERVYGWLQSEAQDEETYAGWLIWEDVINFVELLGAIKFRQELREHDLALIARASSQMEDADGDEPVGETLADELASLTGYSTDIDALIAHGPEATVGAWRRQLQLIRHGG